MINSTSGNPLLFGLFIVLSIIAIAGGKPAKWKLYNFLIILATFAFGIGLGALFAMWGTSLEIAGHLAASFSLIFGSAGAYVCMRRNMKRGSRGPEPGRAQDGPD